MKYEKRECLVHLPASGTPLLSSLPSRPCLPQGALQSPPKHENPEAPLLVALFSWACTLSRTLCSWSAKSYWWRSPNDNKVTCGDERNLAWSKEPGDFLFNPHPYDRPNETKFQNCPLVSTEEGFILDMCMTPSFCCCFTLK